MIAPLHRILISIVIALALVIAAGTVGALIVNKGAVGKGLRKADPTPESLATTFREQKKAAFTLLGQLRTSTAPDEDNRHSVIIVTPWLEYAGDDQALYEELNTKLRSIRAIITGYFPAYTKDQLLSQGEPTVKTELLRRINEQLVLGNVTAIYFNDYQFLD